MNRDGKVEKKDRRIVTEVRRSAGGKKTPEKSKDRMRMRRKTGRRSE